MAISRRFPMPFDVAFPQGVYLTSEVEPVLDFEKSTKDTKVQAMCPDTGLPLWQVTCLDADLEAKKSSKIVTVKIPAKVQPVPPENKGGSPFTQVALEGLTALPWIEESGNFSRIAWSFKADAIVEPGTKPSAATNASGSSSKSSGSAAA
jgi:hypothetical protein